MTKPAYTLYDLENQYVDSEDLAESRSPVACVDVSTAWLTRIIGPKGMLVWRLLNRCTDANGITHISLPSMAKRLKMPERTVSYHLQKLNKVRLAIYDKDRYGLQKMTTSLEDLGDTRFHLRGFHRAVRGRYGKLHCAVPYQAYLVLKTLNPHGGAREGAGRKATGKPTRKDTRNRKRPEISPTEVFHMKNKEDDAVNPTAPSKCGNQVCGPKSIEKGEVREKGSKLLRTASVSEASEPPPHAAVTLFGEDGRREAWEGKEVLASCERPRLTLVGGNPTHLSQPTSHMLQPFFPPLPPLAVRERDPQDLSFLLESSECDPEGGVFFLPYGEKDARRAEKAAAYREIVFRRKLMPHDPLDRMQDVVVPPPPQIPRDANDQTVVRMCLDAYASVLRKKQDKHCWMDFPKLKKSRLYKVLLKTGKELQKYRISPVTWSNFRFSVFEGYTTGKIPTMAWVFSAKAITDENMRWQEQSYVLSRRVFVMKEKREFFQRWLYFKRLVETTLDVETSRARAFPCGRSFDEMVEAINAKVAKIQQRVNERYEDGAYLW